MHTVWKIPLQLVERQEIEVPENATGLCAQLQRDTICLWYHCDPSQPLGKRIIWLVMTGHEAPDPYRSGFWGTVQVGELVFHVFEVMGVLQAAASDRLPATMRN